MRHNPFWTMAAQGGELPERFDLTLWREAWRHGVGQLEQELERLCKRPSIAAYQQMGRAMNRANVLRETMGHIPLFLPWCSAKEWNKSAKKEWETGLRKAVNEFEVLMVRYSTKVWRWLDRLACEGTPQDVQWARQEQLYWVGFSPERAECLKWEFRMNAAGRPMVFTRLNDIDNDPTMKAKFRAKAREMGVSGYAVDPRDPDACTLVSMQHDETIRKNLWSAVQKTAPSQYQVERMTGSRHQIAMQSGYDSYTSYMDHLMPGLSYRSIARVIKQHLAQVAPDHLELNAAMTEKGQRVLAATAGTSIDETKAQLPWNQSYLQWKMMDTNLGLSGNEFPLKRVLHHIIPDLLSVGGWSLVRAPKKIGRGDTALYLYHVHNGTRMAMMYFAPYPHRNVQHGDAYQAYAAVIRERWTGGKATTPMALVAQNFDMKNGSLTDTGQIEFLAHEIGHILHFFALPGETFDEFGRMANNIGELPSILLEQMAHDPVCLKAWSNPRGPTASRRLSYWQRRVKPDRYSLNGYVDDLERSWMDIRAHSSEAPNLRNLQWRLRRDTGLNQVHKHDRSAYQMFDVTDSAGVFCTYVTARGLTAALLRNNTSHTHIRTQMRFLLDNVLVDSARRTLDRNWVQRYGVSMKQMFETGLDAISRQHQRRAKAAVRLLRKH